ncbi:MAG: suppressor of loss of ypt1 [Trizodia sp. TS-e1964]|nr:MAG: suppressor of loss of ypt1 [Trizodia sp. TS-e1964]
MSLPPVDNSSFGKLLRLASPAPNGSAKQPGSWWQSRKPNSDTWASTGVGNSRHGRQKSLSDALKTIRTRRGSILCIIWYLTSALTNTSSKSILNTFKKPITLTLIQFAFVSSWCILFAYAAYLFPFLSAHVPALKNGIRYPTREVILTTLPLAIFQVGGHVLSSTAISKIPVSLVHTIKGLSPLFTVLAYRFIFRIHYSYATYLSLVPLTLGVILACSVEFSGNIFGILYAFIAAIIFVSQNIFSKKLFNEAARAEADGHHQRSKKLDKLNLLCYSSGLAFCLTAPLWLWSEGFAIMGDFLHDGALDFSEKAAIPNPQRLLLEYLFNGTFHFGQNIIAFVLLSMVSPVTYSVASLIKRVFVIIVAILWFGNSTTSVQAVGIGLTFLGLYLYDRTSDAAKADRRSRLEELRLQETLLPLTTNFHQSSAQKPFVSPLNGASPGQLFGSYANGAYGDDKKSDNSSHGRPRASSNIATRLPPGTKQQERWRPSELSSQGISVS